MSDQTLPTPATPTTDAEPAPLLADAVPVLPLPRAVRAFFDAIDAGDPAAAAAAFAPDGVVRDDGESLHVAGRDAVAGWAREHLISATVRLEPLAAEEDDGAWAVEVRVSGPFPGSPGRSTMRFVLDGASIADLRTGAPR